MSLPLSFLPPFDPCAWRSCVLAETIPPLTLKSRFLRVNCAWRFGGGSSGDWARSSRVQRGPRGRVQPPHSHRDRRWLARILESSQNFGEFGAMVEVLEVNRLMEEDVIQGVGRCQLEAVRDTDRAVDART